MPAFAAGARLSIHRSAIAGAALVGALLALAVAGPCFAHHGPLESDFARGASGGGMPVGPSPWFPLGADRLFRDVLARLAWAGRLSLLVGVSAALLATAIGALVGLAAGWNEGGRVRVPWWAVLGFGTGAAMLGIAGFGVALAALAAIAVGAAARALSRRWSRLASGVPTDLDGLLMRLVDVLLAFPFLLLAMAIGAALDHTSGVTLFWTLGGTGWLGIARVVRAKTLQIRSLGYVTAARALGQSPGMVLWRHVLPGVSGVLLVSATTLVAQMLLAESALSYLGAGISPPTPTLGRMLFEGQEDWAGAPWLVAAPGTAIVLGVWGFHLLGEGLRDALDPPGR
ncbi:MAG: ABC transporter permease [Myxococcales bacterium]|nr:ABC transporter permease [Myxococcales bacterium]